LPQNSVEGGYRRDFDSNRDHSALGLVLGALPYSTR